jgi:hypothetical protein
MKHLFKVSAPVFLRKTEFDLLSWVESTPGGLFRRVWTNRTARPDEEEPTVRFWCYTHRAYLCSSQPILFCHLSVGKIELGYSEFVTGFSFDSWITHCSVLDQLGYLMHAQRQVSLSGWESWTPVTADVTGALLYVRWKWCLNHCQEILVNRDSGQYFIMQPTREKNKSSVTSSCLNLTTCLMLFFHNNNKKNRRVLFRNL